MAYNPNNPNGQAVKASSAPTVLATEQETILSAIAKDGTDITSPTAMPTGGVGIRGWLSAIWTKLNGTVTVSNGQTQPLTDTQLRATAVPVSEASAASILTKLTAGATSMVKLEDVASADGDAGTPAMAVRKATPANTSGTDGDYEMLQMSAGRLWASATIDAAIPTGNNNIGDVDVVTVNGVAPAFGSGVRGATVQRVTIATDDVVPAAQSGTWTVQPGNTANTTAWKVDGSAVTQPTQEVATTTISNGKTTVTTAGTRVTLAASTTVKSVTIKALSTNSGIIYVGNATVASTNGFQLSAGDAVSMDIANLNTVNLDSSVNGEGVTYIAIN